MSYEGAPQCQKCKTAYVWDWEMDSYRDIKTGNCSTDGEDINMPFADLAKQQLIVDHADAKWFTPTPTELVRVTIYFCATCNEVIGALVHHDNYGTVVAKRADWPTWQNVDWETLAWENE